MHSTPLPLHQTCNTRVGTHTPPVLRGRTAITEPSLRGLPRGRLVPTAHTHTGIMKTTSSIIMLMASLTGLRRNRLDGGGLLLIRLGFLLDVHQRVRLETCARRWGGQGEAAIWSNTVTMLHTHACAAEHRLPLRRPLCRSRTDAAAQWPPPWCASPAASHAPPVSPASADVPLPQSKVKVLGEVTETLG